MLRGVLDSSIVRSSEGSNERTRNKRGEISSGGFRVVTDSACQKMRL